DRAHLRGLPDIRVRRRHASLGRPIRADRALALHLLSAVAVACRANWLRPGLPRERRGHRGASGNLQLGSAAPPGTRPAVWRHPGRTLWRAIPAFAARGRAAAGRLAAAVLPAV